MTNIVALIGWLVGSLSLTAVAVVFSILLFCFGIIAYFSIYVVREKEVIIIERFGRFNRFIFAGIHLVIPFVDRARSFTWRKTSISASGAVSDSLVKNTRIDLRESIFNFLQMQVFLKENVELSVNALMFYRIHNIKRAIYGVSDVQSALGNAAQAQLREIFGQMTFTEALSSQARVNEDLSTSYKRTYEKFGVKVERLEILDLRSKQRSTTDAMKMQMVAERHRRGDTIRSEGRKTAMLLKASGDGAVAVNMGMAEEEATRKRSEGEALATIECARAEADALRTLRNVLTEEAVLESNYQVAQRFLEILRGLSRTNVTKLFLPYDASVLEGSCVRRVSSLLDARGGGSEEEDRHP